MSDADYWDEITDGLPVVCVAHMRFVPCRPGMRDEFVSCRDSSDPADVERVRKHQQGA